MSITQNIKDKIQTQFSPSHFEIEDESHMHAGHQGHSGHGESHFRLLIVTAEFEGLTRVARHRAVNACLAEELSGPVHALAMKTLTPSEYAAADKS